MTTKSKLALKSFDKAQDVLEKYEHNLNIIRKQFIKIYNQYDSNQKLINKLDKQFDKTKNNVLRKRLLTLSRKQNEIIKKLNVFIKNRDILVQNI